MGDIFLVGSHGQTVWLLSMPEEAPDKECTDNSREFNPGSQAGAEPP